MDWGWDASRLTRRDLLRRAGVVGVTIGLGPSFLAACGGGEEAAGDIGGTINFLTWQGYDLQGFEDLSKWQEDNGITFNATFIATHEDIQAKVTQSPGTYNVITYYQGYWDLYKQLDILSPLERDRVPRYETNYDVFKGARWWESDGELWGVPFTWGSWVITYNPDELAAPSSAQELLSPSLRGKISILDDPNGAIVFGARVLGLELPDLSQGEVARIIDFYRELRKNARAISPSMGDVASLFTAGEAVVCFPSVNTVEGLVKQAGGTAASVVPREGSASYCDAWAIPPETEDRDTAHAWINHTLTPEVQAFTGDSLTQGITQPDAVELLDPTVRELFPYDDLEAWIEQAPLYSLPTEGDPNIVNFQGWLDAWAAFKAEGA